MLDYPPYHVLKNKFGDERIPYGELLSTLEWKNCRNSIIQRDGNKCQNYLAVSSEKIGHHYFRKLTEAERNESYNAYLKTLSDMGELKLKHAYPVDKIDENPIILHVHHTYYIRNILPWQYEHNSLITVCQQYHNNIHLNEKIAVYEDSSKKVKSILTWCERCLGTGFLPQFHYFENGVCFTCNGNRYSEFK